MSNMINDNEDPTEMEYELKGTAAFELGTTSDSNPSKKKKKIKTAKARGPTFSRFEDILLVKAWLATTMDPICGTEQKGTPIGRRFGRSITSKRSMWSRILS